MTYGDSPPPPRRQGYSPPPPGRGYVPPGEQPPSQPTQPLPAYGQPGYQPGYEQPGYQQPRYDQAGYQQPRYDRAGYDQPRYDRPNDQQTYRQPEYAPGGDAYGGYPPPPERSRGGLAVLLIGLAVLLLVGVGGGIFAVDRLTGNDPQARPSATPSAAASSAEPSAASPSATTNSLVSRTTDPEPVTVSELSEGAYTTANGTYTLTGTNASTSCSSAVDAPARAILRAALCSQAVSVTAVNAAKGCVVTAGIVNLPDQATAVRTVPKISGGTKGSFVPRFHAKKEEGRFTSWYFVNQPKGHFIVFASGGYASGKKIAGEDPVILGCDRDMLAVIADKIDARG